MTTLVTGAAGFIGSHLTEALVHAGHAVRAFVFYNSFNSWGWLDHCAKDVKGKFEIFAGDIRDPHGVRAAMKDCDVVLHLAALIAIPYSYHSPDTYVDTTYGTTRTVHERGDTSTTADDRCNSTTYLRNMSLWINSLPDTQSTYSGGVDVYNNCNGTIDEGFSLTLGADMARVFASEYFPSSGPDLTDTRTRVRAGMQWQGHVASVFYGATYLSPEFAGQGEGQVVGSLNVNFRF